MQRPDDHLWPDVQTVGFDQLLEPEGSEGRVFTDMQKWAEIRRRVLTGEISKRAACREYQLRQQQGGGCQDRGRPRAGSHQRVPAAEESLSV